MKRRNGRQQIRNAVLAAIVSIPLAACSTGPTATSDAGRFGKVQEVITAAEREGRFSGEVLVSRDGRIVFQHRSGLASYELGVPFTAETRYKIFSTTKHFTAAAIMLLEQDKKLSVDDPVSRFFTEAPPQWEKVTLAHLLTHTSGIQLSETDLMRNQRPTQAESVAAALGAIAVAELKSRPGETFAYSNAGYTILGAVVEKASGRRYEEFLHERVFVPAGMVHSDVERGVFSPDQPTEDQGSAVAPNLASGYRGFPGHLTPTTSNVYVIAGAGGMYSTPEDLWRYDTALLEERVLSAERQQRMVDRAFRQPGAAGVGFGWFLRRRHGRDMLSHSGGNNGFAVEYARIPSERLCVIVFTNLGFANPEKMRDQVLEALLGDS